MCVVLGPFVATMHASPGRLAVLRACLTAASVTCSCAAQALMSEIDGGVEHICRLRVQWGASHISEMQRLVQVRRWRLHSCCSCQGPRTVRCVRCVLALH